MHMSILIYDGLTTLDAIGGYEVLARIPGMKTELSPHSAASLLPTREVLDCSRSVISQK